MTAGDPKEQMPGFVVDKIKEAEKTLSSYPQIRCSEDLRQAIATWIERRYSLKTKMDLREVHPINGSREGLFFAAMPAVGRKRMQGKTPVMLIVNPFYQAYLGACYGTGCEPHFLNCTAENGYFPDLDALAKDTELLDRVAGHAVGEHDLHRDAAARQVLFVEIDIGEAARAEHVDVGEAGERRGRRRWPLAAHESPSKVTVTPSPRSSTSPVTTIVGSFGCRRTGSPPTRTRATRAMASPSTP